jgi:DNA-binding IscR family transcriptional regulator
VIRSIDGPIVLTACFTEHVTCTHTDRCNVREPLRKVHEGILKLLNDITISDMSHEELKAKGCESETPDDSRLYDVTSVQAPRTTV